MEYDDISRILINKHIQDTLALQELDKISYSENEVCNILEKNGFERVLTKEQLRDCIKLLSLGHGANFSVPGAGKTTTLLAIHSILKFKKQVNALLVVGPRNAFISWEEEVLACYGLDGQKVVRLTGGKNTISSLLMKRPKIMLITYQQLPYVVKEVSSLLIQEPVHLVLDEAHRIKRGSSGAFYLAVIQLADFAFRRDILTGTPMPQSTYDLLPEFDFLWPGQNIIENTIKIDNEDLKIKYINEIIKPLYSRTTKSELNLPKPKVKRIKIKLGPAQQELYSLIKSEAARVLSGMNKDDIKSFRKLGKSVMRLLQAASNPMLITSNDEYPEETQEISSSMRMWSLLSDYSKYEKPAKIEHAINRVKEITQTGEKVVLWSYFVRNINLLEEQLKEFGAVSIYGEIETGSEEDAETREGRIKRFHTDPSCKVLIGNPSACGEGISLHKIAHHAIYVDRTFNAAHYLQSVDRIHRLGLSQGVNTYVEIFQAKDTIDEIVDSRLNLKIDKMGDILNDFDLKTLAYDPEDISEEFPAGIEYIDYDEIINHIISKGKE